MSGVLASIVPRAKSPDRATAGLKGLKGGPNKQESSKNAGAASADNKFKIKLGGGKRTTKPKYKPSEQQATDSERTISVAEDEEVADAEVQSPTHSPSASLMASDEHVHLGSLSDAVRARRAQHKPHLPIRKSSKSKHAQRSLSQLKQVLAHSTQAAFADTHKPEEPETPAQASQGGVGAQAQVPSAGSPEPRKPASSADPSGAKLNSEDVQQMVDGIKSMLTSEVDQTAPMPVAPSRSSGSSIEDQLMANTQQAAVVEMPQVMGFRPPQPAGSSLPPGLAPGYKDQLSRNSATVAGTISSKKVTFADAPAVAAPQSMLGTIAATIKQLVAQGVLSITSRSPSPVHVPQVALKPARKPVIVQATHDMSSANDVHAAFSKVCMGLKSQIKGEGTPDQNLVEFDAVIGFILNTNNLPPATATETIIKGFPIISTGKAREWFMEQLELQVAWTCLDDFCRAYKTRFCRQVRYKQQEARLKFMQGKVKQTHGLDAYIARFKTEVQRAQDMSVTDQIFWFIHGLKSELHDRVLSDANGRPWTDLSALIEYTQGQDLLLATKARLGSRHAVQGTASVVKAEGEPSTKNKKRKATPAAVTAAAQDTKRPATGERKPTLRDTSHIKGKDHEQSRFKPHLTVGEFKRRFAHGLCFECGEKFTTGHECPAKQPGGVPKSAQFLEHYNSSKRLDSTNTAAYVVLPKSQAEKHKQLIQHMTLLHEYPVGTALFLMPTHIGHKPLPAIKDPVQVWYDPPLPLPPAMCHASVSTGAVLQAKVQGVPCTVLLDSGASHCHVDPKFVAMQRMHTNPCNHQVQVAGGAVLQLDKQTRFTLNLQGFHTKVHATIMPLVDGVDVILGRSWLKEVHADLKYRPDGEQVVITPPAGKPRVLKCTHTQDTPDLLDQAAVSRYCQVLEHKQALVINARQALKHIRQGAQTHLVWIRACAEGTGGNGSSQDASSTPGHSMCMASHDTQVDGLVPQHQIDQLLAEYSDVLADELRGGAVDIDLPDVIRLMPNARPVRKPMYRLSPKEMLECQKQITTLLDKGLIQPSTSPWGAPVLFVAKRDASLRLVVDYRGLNRLCEKLSYPLPRVDELIDRLQGCSVTSSLDLFSGYFQLRLKPHEWERTSFVTPLGSFEFKVLAQGLCNAPAAFQAAMNNILAPVRHFAWAYLDDICIASRSPGEHVQHLRQVLDILRKHQLIARKSKCVFNKTEINFLGHVVGRDGLKVDPSKVSTVQEWPTPRNVHDVRRFLGLTNWFRRHIQNYASIAAPLVALTNKRTTFAWGDPEQGAFHALKQALTSAPVLALPDYSKPYDVISDASLLGTGAVLVQDEKPVAFTSKGFSPAERNYHTTDQEMLGVVRALTEWRCYLEGSDFTVYTDHHPLIHIQSQPNLSRRQARWLEFLSRFEPGIKWQYKPGSQNPADGLSRHPLAMAMETSSILDAIKQAYIKDPAFKKPTELTKSYTRSQGFYKLNDLIVVPDVGTLRADVIRMHHAPAYAGHGGTAKTCRSLGKVFYWPKWRRDIKQFVTSCDACQRNKSSNQKPGGLLVPLQIPDRRWEHVTMDLITCLPKTARGYDAILVFVDKLSKMTHFAPTTSDVSAEGTAELFINKVVCLHGLPKKLITDRDKRFTGKFFSAVCDSLDCTSVKTSAWHPQSDGQTERMNRVLEDMLRSYVAADHSDWDKRLPVAEFAVNSSYNSSIGNTPFFLNYGQEPLTPVTVHTDTIVPSARVFAQELQAAIKLAKKTLEQSVQRQKAFADRHRRDVQFQVGDMVLLSTKHFTFKATGTPKFLPKYIGPFPVVKCVGPAAVKLELPPGYKIHPVFHVSLVKHYKRTEHTEPPPAPPDVDEDGMPVYEVEHILAHRQRKQGRQRSWEYLVKWKGYGPEHNSYEPETNFTRPRTIIDAYWSSQGGRPLDSTQARTSLKRPDIRLSARLAARGGGM